MVGGIAIVTGAARRVGRALSEALLADGWQVVGHVHHDEDEVADGVTRVVADLGDRECARTIFAAAEGPVRLLVNCAARFVEDRFGGASAAEFDSHMAVNARAPMLLIDELARRHDGGRALVVNILDAKLAAPNPDYLSYTLSKYAAAGLTELAARALAGEGIRVNAVAPALMLQSNGQDAANFERLHSANPLRRGVEVGDLVAAVRFLVDSKSMTGQTLVIDGGQRFMQLSRDVQFAKD